jgi:cytochrome c peroxidase
MRTVFSFSAILLFISIFYSCSSDVSTNPTTEEIDHIDTELIALMKGYAPNGEISYYRLPESDDFSNIPQDPRNPITRDKVVLGGFLFHETALGISAKNETFVKTFSCASCHHAEAGFQSGVIQGIGEGGKGFGFIGEQRRPFPGAQNIDVQPLRSPTAMNGAYQKNMLWNGQFGATALNEGTEHLWPAGTPIETNKLGFEGLETQAIAGMSVHRLDIDEDVIKMGAYKNLFDQVFAHEPENTRYSKKNVGLAIAAFERTLLSNQAPFQQYLRGKLDAMTILEKEGAKLFFGKAGCVNCHTGPALNSMQFNAIGLADMIDCPEPTVGTKTNDPANLGRGGFTGKASDYYKFKVPQLYNLKDSPFYGHGSTLRSIRDVIVYKNNATPQNSNITTSQLDPLFRPLGLNNSEINAIEAFISNALYDSNLKRYVPDALPSGQCFPNSDVQSRIDLGCN